MELKPVYFQRVSLSYLSCSRLIILTGNLGKVRIWGESRYESPWRRKKSSRCTEDIRKRTRSTEAGYENDVVITQLQCVSKTTWCTVREMESAGMAGFRLRVLLDKNSKSLHYTGVARSQQMSLNLNRIKGGPETWGKGPWHTPSSTNQRRELVHNPKLF